VSNTLLLKLSGVIKSSLTQPVKQISRVFNFLAVTGYSINHYGESMKVIFNNNKVIDFFLRLLLVLIIISPVIYFSWSGIVGTTVSDYITSVIFIFVTGFLWLMSYLFFSAVFGERKK